MKLVDHSVFVYANQTNTYNSVYLFALSKDALSVSFISFIDEGISLRSRPPLALRTYQRRFMPIFCIEIGIQLLFLLMKRRLH